MFFALEYMCKYEIVGEIATEYSKSNTSRRERMKISYQNQTGYIIHVVPSRKTNQ